EIVVDRNVLIDEDVAEVIGAVPGVDKLHLRSPLTCESRFGVCQLCYGWHMGMRTLVKIGDAVGIVAAQSIGEPGTQLTMRTFHTGGVAGLDITSGLPRVEELFEARQPKGKALLSEIDGVAELTRSEDSRIIRIISRETYRDDHVLPTGYELTVQDGGFINAGDPLATPAKEGQPPVVAHLSGIVEVREIKQRNKMVTQATVVAEERDE